MRDLRDIFRRLPKDEGELRHKLRNFNFFVRKNGKAASVKDLAEQIGVDVYQVELPRGMAGRLVSDPFAESGYAIEVQKSQNVRSKRFTVLYDLGHYLIHLDKSDPLADPMFLDRGNDAFYFDGQQECEANDVADTLLFGDGALAAALTLCGGDTNKLANYFGVTEKMIQVALRKYGLRY